MKKIHITILVLIFAISSALRFYKLGTSPAGLYWDEAAFGYDAYSILKTGHDHHGKFMPLLFESFGDWKLPGYFYLLVPSIKAFGLNHFAVRFPSAFFGALTPLILFFLTKKLTKNSALALTCAFFLAISPWHIQFSRGGFESTPALFFTISGLYLFIVAMKRKKPLLITSSFLLFVMSMYTYHAYRIFTPFLIFAIFTIFFNRIKKIFPKLIVPSLIAIITILPLVNISFSQIGIARALSQSALKKQEFEAEKISYDQKSKKPLRFLSRHFYKKPIYYTSVVTNGYLDHFSPTFLFVRGDQIGRHSQVDMGQIYIFDAIFIILAFFALYKLPRDAKRLMLAWLILAPIPASIVLPTPHAYRTLQMIIPLTFFSALGAHLLFTKIRFLTIKLFLITFMIYFQFLYLHLLFGHYPQKFAADWQDGYKQMVEQIEKYQVQFEKVYVTNINQVPYIYVLFYQSYNPEKFTSEKGTKDKFNKYVFISPQFDIYNKGRLLYVAPSWQRVDGRWLSAANDSTGRHIYSLWEVGGKN